ncbi:hypothetical protein MUP65_02890, partial [Patescibacteria group bacterium]|nr:hypothetical protein [Patescibacteria group bacterium]
PADTNWGSDFDLGSSRTMIDGKVQTDGRLSPPWEEFNKAWYHGQIIPKGVPYFQGVMAVIVRSDPGLADSTKRPRFLSRAKAYSSR